jgi:hypothetical protein
MRIVTVAFNYPPERMRPDYLRLLDVFESSVHKHIPHANLIVRRIDPPDTTGVQKFSFLSNNYKLKVWAQEMAAAYDAKEDVIICDADMLCTNDPSSVFDHEFDIAYTVRGPESRIPLNGGVVFAHPTDEAYIFFQDWVETDAKMYEDHLGTNGRKIHGKWRQKYAGLNQASFGYLLETNVGDVNFMPLPTVIYNAVDTDWHAITSETCFVHIKSQLRKRVLKMEPPTDSMRPAMIAWYQAAGIDEREFAK